MGFLFSPQRGSPESAHEGHTWLILYGLLTHTLKIVSKYLLYSLTYCFFSLLALREYL